jgi:hypothetical protein
LACLVVKRSKSAASTQRVERFQLASARWSIQPSPIRAGRLGLVPVKWR